MSLRDVSNSALLAIMAEWDIHNILFYHSPLLSVEGLTLKAETWTGDNIVYIFDFT